MKIPVQFDNSFSNKNKLGAIPINNCKTIQSNFNIRQKIDDNLKMNLISYENELIAKHPNKNENSGK